MMRECLEFVGAGRINLVVGLKLLNWHLCQLTWMRLEMAAGLDLAIGLIIINLLYIIVIIKIIIILAASLFYYFMIQAHSRL